MINHRSSDALWPKHLRNATAVLEQAAPQLLEDITIYTKTYKGKQARRVKINQPRRNVKLSLVIYNKLERKSFFLKMVFSKEDRRKVMKKKYNIDIGKKSSYRI